MRSIEVDFDVHQAIEAERRSFAETPNAALRRLLGLREAAGDTDNDGSAVGPNEPNRVTEQGLGPGTPLPKAWRSKGLTLAEGTALMLKYSEVREPGSVSDGNLVFNGEGYSSPSPAAMDVVQRHRGGGPVSINGWLYVYAQRNGESQWRTLADLRSDTAAEQAIKRVAELGQRVAPFAEAQGWLTDEDVFKAVS